MKVNELYKRVDINSRRFIDSLTGAQRQMVGEWLGLARAQGVEDGRREERAAQRRNGGSP